MPVASSALARFKVIDLTRVRAGPTCARQLADWGADVIKIELPADLETGEPMGGPRNGPDFQNLHRNKRGLTLNLKDPEGVAILKRLAASADVVVENFRPDVKHRLGIDYEALSAANPRLVYASISGFGQDGPYADRPGFDQIAQGMGGLMSITGEPGHGPMRVGIPIADLCAGIFAAQGILVALLERETSGKGQWVQSSLLQAQIFMLDFQAARWLMRGEVPPQAGNNHPTSIPTGVFRTRDGHINIAAAGHQIWERLARVLDADAWLTDPRFATGAARSDNRDALQVEIDARTVSDDSASWIERLNAAGVPCGPINTIDQTFAEPQVQHLGIARDLDGTKYVGQPMALSRTPSTIANPPPARGQHTAEILRELGLSAQEVERLQARNIV
jgi:crotonobetainyl-CoA:carnitine CoA-transferase CaiB-like acyl-CoA transferase